MIRIRSVKQYINDFLVEGLKHTNKQNLKASDVLMIKQQMLDAFRKEIFEQIADKIGTKITTANRNELALLEPVQNILKNSFRKWKRICIICGENGLGGLFGLEDLKQVLDETEDEPREIIYPEDSGEDVTDRMDEILPEGEEPVYLEDGAEKETAESV